MGLFIPDYRIECRQQIENQSDAASHPAGNGNLRGKTGTLFHCAAFGQSGRFGGGDEVEDRATDAENDEDDAEDQPDLRAFFDIFVSFHKKDLLKNVLCLEITLQT